MVEWKDVVGFEGRYRVSSDGQVLSLNYRRGGHVMSPKITRGGYPWVGLSDGQKPCGFNVHSLVAAAFIGKRPDGMDVNHKNGIKTDNRAENLEYCTRSENIRHAFARKLHPGHRGERNPRSKIMDGDVPKILEMVGLGRTHASIAQIYGVSPSQIKRGLRAVSEA